MKRIIAALAMLAILATGALAQTSDPYSNPSSTPSTTPDPAATSATTDSDMNNENLPATASPLPLLALSGLGMLGTGAWLIRRRRNG